MTATLTSRTSDIRPAPLRTEGPFTVGSWYVAATVAEVPERGKVELSICGQAVSFWRENGAIRGRAASQPDETLDVRCTEDLVWIYVSCGQNGPESPRINVPEFDGPKGRVRFMEKVEIPAHQDDAIYGLLDPAHTPFVHRSPIWRGNGQLKRKKKNFEPSELGFTMKPHAPVNSDIYKLIGGAISVTIEFRLPGLRAEYISNAKHTVLGLTALTPKDERHTTLRQIFYWDTPVLNLLRPFARMVARPFLQQDVDIMALRRQNEPWANGKGMLVGDSDKQFLWYLQLKKEWQAAGYCPHTFDNPLESATLRWRT
ncbi:hypothetical protein [Henriciella sp.]|uniref:hypothetical protein n=1 Tax=Henriciella sp. TaxID=1968823 RepID=UPI0026313351|nr:hypothetical protein [Henriciella sp.]